MISYIYSTVATDPNGDAISYTFDWGDASGTTTGLTNSGVATGASHVWSLAGTYAVKVKAIDSKGAASPWSVARTVQIAAPNAAPYTPAAPTGPATGSTGSTYAYSAATSDPNGDAIFYTFDWGDGTTTTTGPVVSGLAGSASHVWTVARAYSVRVQAVDARGAVSGWSIGKAVAISGPNLAPSVPAAPAGPASGRKGVQLSYVAAAVDPNGDLVKYTFDWGDGKTSSTALAASGTPASAAHAWTLAGTYAVKVKAVDSKGAASAWSTAFTVTVTN